VFLKSGPIRGMAFRGLDLLGVRGMVFNTTFNNILAISWQSVLLVEEICVPEKKQ
jgi:hypothetical protein